MTISRIGLSSRAVPGGSAVAGKRRNQQKKAGARAKRAPETSLYAPVKSFLELQGYQVKGEIHSCDLVATRGEEPPVIVELKAGLSFELLLQGVDRMALTDHVYLAIPAPRGPSAVQDRRFHKLLRRIGLGLLLVHPHGGGTVEALLDPEPYRPRRDTRKLGRLLREFQRRVGDPNAGGSTRVKLVTAYRQECLRIAWLLAARGPSKPALLRAEADSPRAGRILLDDVYGWFERVERGLYGLTPAGTAALQQFAGRYAPPTSAEPASRAAAA
jgi:hypothetical protein